MSGNNDREIEALKQKLELLRSVVYQLGTILRKQCAPSDQEDVTYLIKHINQ